MTRRILLITGIFIICYSFPSFSASYSAESANYDGNESSRINSQDTVVNWEILVEPQRNVIYNGEQTTITIDLHGFDTAGQKIQAFRPDVLVEINGIIDGTAVPGSGKISWP